MDSEYWQIKPTRRQWIQLHTAVQQFMDVHPIQGWELGEYVAEIKAICEEATNGSVTYIYMNIISQLRTMYPSLFDHIETGCSRCLSEMQLLSIMMGPPNRGCLKEGRTCVSCERESPFAALFCVWCGRRIRDLHFPFYVRRVDRE
jgi:hypothetical protein